MKNREKFLLIFVITIVVLSLGSIISGYIGFSKTSDEQVAFWKEVDDGRTKDKYTFEIEDGIKQNMRDEVDYTAREEALNAYLSYRNTKYSLAYADTNARMTETINLLFYSLSITIFVYLMITLKYKNKTQYLLDNLGILMIFAVLWVINNALELSGPLLFANCHLDILSTLYIMFLIGNIIKNITKRKNEKQAK